MHDTLIHNSYTSYFTLCTRILLSIENQHQLWQLASDKQCSMTPCTVIFGQGARGGEAIQKVLLLSTPLSKFTVLLLSLNWFELVSPQNATMVDSTVGIREKLLQFFSRLLREAVSLLHAHGPFAITDELNLMGSSRMPCPKNTCC